MCLRSTRRYNDAARDGVTGQTAIEKVEVVSVVEKEQRSRTTAEMAKEDAKGVAMRSH